MKALIVSIVVLLLALGAYGAWRFIVGGFGDASPEEVSSGEFSAERGGLGGETPFQSESAGRENYIVFTHQAPSSTVVLLQPKQPTTEQPALPQSDARAGGSEIAAAFYAQVPGTGPRDSKGTIAVSNFALHYWGDDTSGGEALFKYEAAQGWKLISMGGGAWGVTGLVDSGVPRSVAERLVADKPWAQ